MATQIEPLRAEPVSFRRKYRCPSCDLEFVVVYKDGDRLHHVVTRLDCPRSPEGNALTSDGRGPQACALHQAFPEEAAMKRLEAGNTARSGCKGRDVARVVVPEDDAIVRLDVAGIVLFYRERRPSAETRTASHR